MNKNLYSIKGRKDLPDSRAEFELEISPETVAIHRKEVLQELNSKTEMAGFRRGHIPEKILTQRFGEFRIWEEQARQALSFAITSLFENENISSLGHPDIIITKIAPKEILEAKVTITVLPKIDLPDYKALSREVNATKEKTENVTEKEVDETIENIRKQLSAKDAPDSEKNSASEIAKQDLPELNDAFVQTLGNFKNVEEFKARVKENLMKEKEHRSFEKHRIKLAEKISTSVDFPIPDILIDSELHRMEARFRGDVERMGIKYDDYLAHIKKSADQVRVDWRPDAIKRVKIELILNKIAEKEKLFPDAEKVEAEVNHIMEHNKNADRSRVKSYVESALENDKVFEFLEKQQ
ncbi:MAG: trigger factor [bacterium]|nr:trigger factor [bacterium]